LYLPILNGAANKQDWRSALQITGGGAIVFSYLAGPEIVNRQLRQSFMNPTTSL